MQWRHWILYPLPPSNRHVVGHATFGIWSKMDVPSTSMSRRGNRLLLLDSKRMIYKYFDKYESRWFRFRLVVGNADQGNGKWRHCHLIVPLFLCTFICGCFMKIWKHVGAGDCFSYLSRTSWEFFHVEIQRNKKIWTAKSQPKKVSLPFDPHSNCNFYLEHVIFSNCPPCAYLKQFVLIVQSHLSRIEHFL